MPEVLEDISGSEHMHHVWGDRFRCWYLTKNLVRTETMVLEGDITYRFRILDYNYRFIMSPYIRFTGGIISYSEAERLLGVFRFPRQEDGRFSTPLTVGQMEEGLMHFSEEELAELVRRKSVLTFEAFRIPQFGYEYLHVSPGDFMTISKLMGEEFEENFKTRYDADLEIKTSEVKSKIASLPDYPLILQRTLDLDFRDLDEVSSMTGNIIHI